MNASAALRVLMFTALLAAGFAALTDRTAAQGVTTAVPRPSDAAKRLATTVHPDRIIVAFARERLGQTVGRGECTDLVDAALAAAKVKPGRNYVWGREVTTPRAGNIIQFWDAHFTYPGGSWGTAKGDKHTAIVMSARGPEVTLIHQNDGQRIVTTRTINLAWKRDRGSYKIYQAVRQ